MPFENLQIYRQRLLLLFRREHTQHHLQTPKELDSVVMPMCCMLPKGETRLSEELTSEGYVSSYLF